MNSVLRHVRSNVVAYLALFVALGGTAYAATSLPANSVGSRQIKNGAVTASKLASTALSGHVVFVAQVTGTGTVQFAYPPVKVGGANNFQIALTLSKVIPNDCPIEATVDGSRVGGPAGIINIERGGGSPTTNLVVQMFGPGGELPAATAPPPIQGVELVAICR